MFGVAARSEVITMTKVSQSGVPRGNFLIHIGGHRNLFEYVLTKYLLRHKLAAE